MKKIMRKIGYAIFTLISLLYIYPVICVFLNSFKTSAEIRTSGVNFPATLYFGNYKAAWIQGNFGRSFLNSVLVTGLSLILIYTVNLITSYPFARAEFKGKKAFYILFLSGIMFPIQMAVIPLFKMITRLHLVNNPIGLVFVYTAFSIPMGIMLIGNAIKEMPVELEEAARLDGCKTVILLFRIILPVIKPVMGTVMIINAINTWNDLLLPIITLTTKDSKTMPAGLMYFSGQYSTQWEFVTAAVIIISIPMILFYLVMQKDIVNGLAAGAVKS